MNNNSKLVYFLWSDYGTMSVSRTNDPSASIGKQVFASFVDGTIQNLLFQMLSKALRGDMATKLESWKDDIKAIIELIYGVISLEIDWIQSFIKSFWNITGEATGTPAMSILGLKWGKKGSTVLYVLLFLLKVCATKLYKLSLNEGWRTEEGFGYKRQLAEVLRFSIIAGKSLSIVSFLTFICFSDNAPSLLLRLSGYRVAPVSDNRDVSYRPSQLYLEQRKFMWLAMIGLASATMVSIDWDYIRRVAWRQYQQCIRFISGLYQIARRKILNAPEVDESLLSIPSGEYISNSGIVECARCARKPPDNPHKNASCGHIFCYLCVAPYFSHSGVIITEPSAEIVEDELFDEIHLCPLCSKVITTAIPWST